MTGFFHACRLLYTLSSWSAAVVSAGRCDMGFPNIYSVKTLCLKKLVLEIAISMCEVLSVKNMNVLTIWIIKNYSKSNLEMLMLVCVLLLSPGLSDS